MLITTQWAFSTNVFSEIFQRIFFLIVAAEVGCCETEFLQWSWRLWNIKVDGTAQIKSPVLSRRIHWIKAVTGTNGGPMTARLHLRLKGLLRKSVVLWWGQKLNLDGFPTLIWGGTVALFQRVSLMTEGLYQDTWHLAQVFLTEPSPQTPP